MTSPDDRLEQHARALFQQACQDIDPATAGRLRAARREALQPAPAGHRMARLLLPTGAMAVLALATLLIWQPHNRASAPQAAPGASAVADTDNELPPDADSADPNLYQDLDFYGWLAANSPAQGRR